MRVVEETIEAARQHAQHVTAMLRRFWRKSDLGWRWSWVMLLGLALIGGALPPPAVQAQDRSHQQATTQAAPAGQPKTCRFGNLGGLIMERWRELGGPNSPLGCPIESNERIGWANSAARLLAFENGEASWSPYVPGVPVLFAWREGDLIQVKWKNSDSYEYTDKWIVRWDQDGQNVGQDDFHQLPTRDGGAAIGASWYHEYTILVEGCDSRCRGWMQPVTIYQRIPGLRAEVKVGNQVQVLYNGDTALRDSLDPMWGAYRAKAKRTLRDTLANNSKIHDFTFDLADEGEARTWMNGQTIVMEYVIPGWFNAHANWDGPGIFGNPEFRVNFDMVVVLNIPVSDARQRFQVSDAHVEVRNVRVDSGNFLADLVKALAPSVLRDIARKISDEANNNPGTKLTDTVNTFLLPITNTLLKVPPGFVYLNAWVDYKSKIHLQFGPGRGP